MDEIPSHETDSRVGASALKTLLFFPVGFDQLGKPTISPLPDMFCRKRLLTNFVSRCID